MADKQVMVPGGSFVNETNSNQEMIPASKYINETSGTSASPVKNTAVIIKQAVNRASTF